MVKLAESTPNAPSLLGRGPGHGRHGDPGLSQPRPAAGSRLGTAARELIAREVSSSSETFLQSRHQSNGE
jgi:hypothetical protein